MDITISKHDIFLKDILNKSTEYIDYPCTVDRLMISIDNIKDISVSSGDKADIISLLRQQYLMRNEINNGSEKQYDFSEKYQLLTGLAVIRKFLIKKREKHSVCDKNIIINTLIKLITELKITAAANSNLKKNNRLINQLIKILNQMIDYNKRELRLSKYESLMSGRFVDLLGLHIQDTENNFIIPDNYIGNCITEIKETLLRVLSKNIYQAVFIVGGTGRNEPWDTREIISGHPQDIDIMLILKDKNSDTADAVSFVKEYLQPISLKYGLKLDILPPAKYSDFKKGPVNRFQYSVRYGKILWGSLNQNLLKYQVVNTNLSYSSFNEAILRRGSGIINFKSVYYDNDIQISSMIKKHITANVYKFVISCGDAILFALGRFAEIEKYRDILMQQSLEIPDDFKKLYKQALDFRKKRVFLPFEKMTKADLIKWINKSTCITSPVYLKFQEYHLLTDNLTWEGYPKKAVNKEFSTISAALGKTLLNNLKNYLSENISAPSVFEKISVEAARELISIIMPALIFDINNRYLNSMIMQMTCFNQEIKNIYKLYSNIYRQCCLKKDFDFLGLINSNKQ